MIKTIKQEINRLNVFCFDNIVYSNRLSMWGRENIQLKMNLIIPFEEKRVFKKRPTIVWLEGGGWSNSTPFYRIPELSFYAYNGFNVANVSYSVSNANIWPSCIEDAKTAIRFLRANSDKYGIDENNIFVAGESAGAHLAAMIGLCDKYKTDEYIEYSDNVNGVITFYCPGDFVEANSGDSLNSCGSRLLGQDIYNNLDLLKEISPTEYVKENEPPFLMFHGDKDNVVDVNCSINLHNKLVEKGNICDLYILKDAEHAAFEFSELNVQNKVLDFLKTYIK